MSSQPNAYTQSLNELAALHQLKVIGIEQLNLENENVVVHRPWIDEPSGSVPFDEENGIALPVVGSGFVPVLIFYVPNGYDGVIKYISNNVTFAGFTNFSGDIVWQITADGKPIRNFQAILAEKGTVAQGREVSPIRIYSGQTIIYAVNHVANLGLAGQVVCSLNGYIYPSKGVS